MKQCNEIPLLLGGRKENMMDNQNIAKLLARETFKSHKENSLGYAVQLFVERVVLPDEINSYNIDEIENYILKFLEAR